MATPTVASPLDPTNMSAGTTTYSFPGATSASYGTGTDAFGHTTGNFNVSYGGGQGFGAGGGMGNYGPYGMPLSAAQVKAGQAADAAALAGKPINFASITPQQALPAMMDSYEYNYNDAKNTNLSRYNQILQGFQQRQTDTANQMGSLPDNWGQAQQAVLSQQFAQQQANANQNLANLGMSNTTVPASVDAGIGLQQGLASNSLADQIAQTKAQFATQRAQTNMQTSGDTLNFMNSRQDPYPDSNQLVQLAQMYGQGSLGYLGGLGGYGGEFGGYGGGGGMGAAGIGGSAYGGFAGNGFGLPMDGGYAYVGNQQNRWKPPAAPAAVDPIDDELD